MAKMLLLAFDDYREQQYLADARTILQPLLHDSDGIRAQSGYGE